jgi:YNFM family putative membrane transporter
MREPSSPLPPSPEPSIAQRLETALEDAEAFIERGTAVFLHTNLALFAAGFATFSLLYCVQPLLPEFSRDFRLSAAISSLSLSLTTGLLAVSMLLAGFFSESWGRKPLMVGSLVASGLLTIVAAVVPSWQALLVSRALMGITLSGLPAVAMAYLSEEMHPKSIGLAMGLYIGGSGLGGMSGRLIVGVLTDLFGWRVAVGAIGCLGLVSAAIVLFSLPASRHFRPRPLAFSSLVGGFRMHLADAALPWLFLEGFILMGSFVTLYNYIGYRLLAPPFSLSQTAVGFIFTVYTVGIFSSAWMGSLAGRFGPRHMLWVPFVIMLAGTALTCAHPLGLIIGGIALVTFGFFGGHAIASSWIGLRARRAKAQASSLYLFFYYLGSSVVGSLGGVVWSRHGWVGVTELTSVLLVGGVAVAAWLYHVKPLPAVEARVGH